MPFTHSGAADKIRDIKQEFRWSEDKARRFHDWLGKSYPSEKDEMSYTQLRQAAQEFNSQDRGS
jgi:hypothetical protein